MFFEYAPADGLPVCLLEVANLLTKFINFNVFTMRGLNGKKLEKEFLDAYDRYAEAILRHAYLRVDSRAIAQDLTSETFTKTWQFLANGGKVKNFKSFLYRVCNNLIIDYYRSKAKTNVSLEDVTEQSEPAEELPYENIDMGVAFEMVKKHLDSLPADYKQILIHRYIDELDVLEIKEITGKSVTNIYTIIHRGLKILRKKIHGKEN